MAGVAGANIANAAGRPDAAGDPVTAAVVQDPIGAYIQDADAPTSNTNYVGVNVLLKWDFDAMSEGVSPAFTSEATQDVTAGGEVQWVKAGDEIAQDGLCTITDGVAAADVGGSATCMVVGGVIVDDYFWAVL